MVVVDIVVVVVAVCCCCCSLRLARSHCCQQLSLSVCPDVCLSCPFKLLFLFCFSMESSHFGPLVLHYPVFNPSAKSCSQIFYLCPKFTPQNLHKIAYHSACMAHIPEMFRPNRGFSEMADSNWPTTFCMVPLNDSMEPYKMLWATRMACHGNEIWARRGDPVAYRLVKDFTLSLTAVYIRKRVSKRYERCSCRCCSSSKEDWTSQRKTGQVLGRLLLLP